VGPDATFGGADIARPLLISPSVEEVDGVVPLAFHGRRWPGTTNWVRAPAKPFGENDWDLDKFLIAVLGEFVQVSVGGKAWHELMVIAADGPPNEAETTKELDELRSLIEYRGGVFEEALAQRAGMLTYMRGVLNFRASSHPATYKLCMLGFHIAQFQNMYWKRAFARPRPSRVDPALLPPIEVPGHGAYPSGHACEAMMVALILEQVLPAVIVPADPENGPLRTLARRIARNREVLGLHYPSDTACGFRIAARSLPLFLACATMRGTAAVDSSGGPLLDANGLPVNQAGTLRAQPGFTATEAPIINDTGAIFTDGLLARARAEWA